MASIQQGDHARLTRAQLIDLVKTTKGTPTEKLIAVLMALGITSTAALAEHIGISDRAIRKARANVIAQSVGRHHQRSEKAAHGAM